MVGLASSQSLQIRPGHRLALLANLTPPPEIAVTRPPRGRVRAVWRGEIGSCETEIDHAPIADDALDRLGLLIAPANQTRVWR
jgi:hypothetical protein